MQLRPLPSWPYANTRRRRSRWAFTASYPDTLALLDRELAHLGAQHIVLGVAFREEDLRLDGMPRASAREPEHPGVEISFNATRLDGQPRLVYATDVCERWQHNVRSIALGLQSLRAVDRYGITRRNEQYAGWKALTSGGAEQPSYVRGEMLIREHGGWANAVKATHPDKGGDPIDFQSVQMAGKP